MLNLSNLRLPIGAGPSELYQAAARALGIPVSHITELSLTRQSIDARKKSDVHLVCSLRLSVRDEQEVLQRAPKGVTAAHTAPYTLPSVGRTSPLPPVVVGMGPAGLMAALTLAQAGLQPILLERGRPVEQRAADVEQFWATGQLSPHSNVQFGEGGAGTFSDGKLTTGIHDPRIGHIFETFVRHGAPEDILWSHKPHIGTDLLRGVVRSIRMEIQALGGQVRFEHRLHSLQCRDGALTAAVVMVGDHTYELPCDTLILAPGHSARDTFQMLFHLGIPLQPKSFAIGVRIEHSQQKVSAAQFGPQWERLPAADYKLACHLPSGRSVFSFCVCPGGQVVASASDAEQVVTNGMSLRARDEANINGGLLVGISPDDFGADDPLAGVRFQQQWERAAWEQGGRNFHAPAQRVGDFLGRRPSTGPGSILPTYRPGVRWGDLTGTLPDDILAALREAIPLLDRKLNGFADPDAILTGVETRSSSPVRILRGPDFQSPGLAGLYPCGEGAGYAGGITSAAVDGMKVAEAIIIGC